MANTTMTSREFFKAVVEGNITVEVKDFAELQIRKLDNKNAKRKSTDSKTQKENREIKKTLLTTFENDKIYIASLEELNVHNPGYTVAGQGEPYIMFTDANSRKIKDTYWTRSTAGARSYHTFCIIDLDGRLSINGGANNLGIVIYFSI